MTNGASFRSKLDCPEHRQLFDYWESLCANGQLPCRSSLSPVEIRRLLPAISLIDVAQPLDNSKVRLAGTKLREVYGREITGLSISDVFACEERKSAYCKSVEEEIPQKGATLTQTGVQHWLKLPLRCRSESVRMVLCLDVFESASEMASEKKLAIA
jgi:hypothetical protein